MLAAFFGRVLLGFALSLPQVWAQTNLPAWPLAVKAPFFNSWYMGGKGSVPLSSASPISWSFQDMGWFCAIIVDGAAFRLMGAGNDPPIEPAQQLLVELTPTRTIFAMQAGPVFVNLTFFTPVTVRLVHAPRACFMNFNSNLAHRSSSAKHSFFLPLCHGDVV